MTENEIINIDECLKELKTHRDTYLKRSTPWRIVNRAIRLIEQYRVIGTVEEFKALKEKNEPKKIVKRETSYKCPSCNGWVGYRYRYCDWCGHALDWHE